MFKNVFRFKNFLMYKNVFCLFIFCKLCYMFYIGYSSYNNFRHLLNYILITYSPLTM